MKRKFFIVLLLANILSFSLIAQETKKSYSGFGIEAGVGYNTMQYTLFQRVGGGDSTASLNVFWLQPCIRLHYDIFVKQLGLNNSMKVKPFLGYYTFGGKAKSDNIGNNSILAFGTIEAGVGLAFDIKNLFQITPLIKGQYVFSASKRTTGVPAPPVQDLKSDFKSFSSNIGLQMRFKYKHFTLGAEGWLGLTNFNKKDGKTAKENNYRLLIGYEF